MSDKIALSPKMEIRRNELSLEVSIYADNLQKQIAEVFSAQGLDPNNFKSAYEEFSLKAKKGKVNRADFIRLRVLTSALRDISRGTFELEKGVYPAFVDYHHPTRKELEASINNVSERYLNEENEIRNIELLGAVSREPRMLQFEMRHFPDRSSFEKVLEYIQKEESHIRPALWEEFFVFYKTYKKPLLMKDPEVVKSGLASVGSYLWQSDFPGSPLAPKMDFYNPYARPEEGSKRGQYTHLGHFGMRAVYQYLPEYLFLVVREPWKLPEK